jgi:predicted dehydrogenase
MREPAIPLKLGMVGGGQGAFIGAVHRMAARLDGAWQIVAGALSSTPERALESGHAIGLPRVYPTWEEMLERERALPEGERIDAVSVVTPNFMHYPVAKAFTDAGFHVVSDKPMVLNSEQANELVRAVDAAGTIFAVTYNYTGYPMVKEARRLVQEGAIGDVRKVIVEYNQGWLATKLEDTGAKQAEWRTDPARSGIGGAIGDIGSHAENLVATVTGLQLEAMCADLTTFVPGRHLDDDANLLLRFRGGAKGVLIASQIEVGEENDLRIRVYGTRGGLVWHQEEPNRLIHKTLEGPTRVLTRNGGGYLGAAAQANSRLPSGHPEAFIEAFANVYTNVAAAIAARQGGASGTSASGGPGVGASAADGAAPDFPTVLDGARGVAFIEAAVASSASDAKWTPFEDPSRGIGG